MGLVALAEELGGAVVVAVTEVELARGGGHIQKWHVHLLSHLLHLPDIIHGMVVSRNRLIEQQFAITEQVELVTEIVLSVAADGAVVQEVFAADRCYEHRRATELARLIDIPAEIILVRCARARAAEVGQLRLAMGTEISIVLEDVQAVVFLVVMCELYKHVVAGSHLRLDGCPERRLLVERTRGGA